MFGLGTRIVLPISGSPKKRPRHTDSVMAIVTGDKHASFKPNAGTAYKHLPGRLNRCTLYQLLTIAAAIRSR
ncbi:hypothetical protein CERSUDRAFT_101184 [Gelatoporia subvermispora B]|uniref:Uncharacterized protein n=1 Tax=Ceriporiopsis subvermispora (strain B) TaxID=914234 RepID=M2QVQ8_CERS8|nr:hypothetical protein CERSUDRAFT_101184 [Gelatoporia subvermispora B]